MGHHGFQVPFASVKAGAGEALDDRAIAVLQDLLREALAAGKTIVMSTHQLREALELSSHVALLNRGQVAFEGPCTPEMVEHPGYVYARYGEG